MNQVMHSRHGYDPSKLDAPPRPPTSTKKDKEKVVEAKRDQYWSVAVTLPKGSCSIDDSKLQCLACKDSTKKYVKKIKSCGDDPLCWDCVSEHFKSEAQFVWYEE